MNDVKLRYVPNNIIKRMINIRDIHTSFVRV